MQKNTSDSLSQEIFNMKITNLIAIITLACVISGCTTTNWQKPDGFHGGDKEFVTLKFKPQISIGLGKDRAEEIYLENYIATKLADSKRFNVLASGYKGDYSNNATVVLELTPTVRLIRSDRSRTTALFKVITTIDCKNVDLQTGTYSGVGTFAVRGTPKVPYVSKAPVGAYHQPDIPGLCEESYNAALKQFIQKLNCLFPVTGSVSGMVTFGNKTTFQFMRGTIDGVESFDDILIYAVENKRISPTIAIAKAEVALNQSTLTVTEWNTSDPEVKNNLMPRIFSGDSTLRLYAVCRKNVK